MTKSITWKGRSAAVMVCAVVGAGVALPADAATPVPTKHRPAASLLNGLGDTLWGAESAAEANSAITTAGSWSASRDLGSLSSITADYGMRSAWARGITGKGVTVAVIDTGIAPVEGLNADNKVVNGPDLSFDGQAAGTRYVDGYGHGTHMAGIIAGRDDKFDRKDPDPAGFNGIAPDAQLLNMKVGATDGGTDVSQVIAALDWVVAHRKDNGMNVRVVNLAYGTESVQPWQVDPLARAVENAWNAGIVVVTAAGNDGLAAPSLLMPAADPHVLAVGAVDNEGTATKLDDDVADFTNGGNSSRRPDVLAPGRSVVSLRVPGSYVDTMHPEGLVAGDTSGRFFRGSGTSQATAVTSGEVALLLQARPYLTPDQVKALLKSTADPVYPAQPAMGAGVTDLIGALFGLTPLFATPNLADSTGTGSLEASRGGEHVTDPATGRTLTGEVDALGTPWDGAAWSEASAKGTSWSAGSWNGRVWTGKSWAKAGWSPAAWTGDSWNGSTWENHAWSDATWQASTWRDAGWEASTWREAGWEASTWRGANWEASSWREESWLASTWRSLP